ncbi:hypothetical protein AB0P21_29455 [Kribbella sp. NPDC056861]|uniref:hypothetical protein n=1 Tax=Kribbella sp. NPDC056861 TaxID=3154857 RepID=UPI0034155961
MRTPRSLLTATLLGGLVLTTAGAVPADARPLADAAADPKPPASCLKDPTPREGKTCGHSKILLITYTMDTPCKIYPNHSRKGTPWTVTGTQIIWRYNVSSKTALVSDPRGHDKGFPWWGFTDTDCIGTTVGQPARNYWRYESGKWRAHKTPAIPAGQVRPKRKFQARSQSARGWVDVDWRPAHGAIPGKLVKTTKPGTLRDKPNSLVIGNVPAGWRVRPTGQHDRGWTFVYVPNLKRWGWIMS